MIIQIDEGVLDKYNLTHPQFFLLAMSKFNYTKEDIDVLTERGLIGDTYNPDIAANAYFATDAGLEAIRGILSESIKLTKEEKDSLNDLASQMAELFPKGKKSNTTKYWRGNSGLVKQKLKIFFKKYGHFSNEVILEATKKYIESFGDNLTLMRTLPYFIEKNNESELLTTIENLEDVAPNNDDWIHTMV